MITLLCKHCAEPIVESDELPHWQHEETNSALCDEEPTTEHLAGPRAEPDLARLVSDAIAALAPTYTLAMIEHPGDRLTAEQIQALLDGASEGGMSSALDSIQEWESDQRWDAARRIVHDLLPDELVELLDRDGTSTSSLNDIEEEIMARDESCLETALLRNTPDELYRYHLNVSVPDYTMDHEQRAATRQEIADAAGLDLSDKITADKIDELLANSSYGGELYVLWCGNAEQAVTLATPVRWNADHNTESTDVAGTVTFTGASLLILDRWNGSGHEVSVPTITAEWAPRRVTIDAKGINGYSWTDTASPSPRFYAATFTVNRPTDAERNDR